MKRTAPLVFRRRWLQRKLDKKAQVNSQQRILWTSSAIRAYGEQNWYREQKTSIERIALCEIFEKYIHDVHVYIGDIILELLLIGRQPAGLISRKK